MSNVLKKIGQTLIKPKLAIPPKTLTVFTRQLATMLEAGLPMLTALDTLVEQCRGSYKLRGPRMVLEDVKAEVESGHPLSEALKNYPKTFDRFYANMVQSGEASGAIVQVLNNLADYMERMQAFKKKVLSSLTYPAVVLTVALGVTIILLAFIVPKFVRIFKDLLEGEELPAITRAVKGASGWTQNNILTILIIGVVIGVGLKLARRTYKGRFIMDFVLIKTPPIKAFVLRTAVSRFSSTLSTLLSAGVPVLQAMQIVYETTSNEVVRHTIRAVYDSISEGRGISPALETTRLFPLLVTRLIGVGEKTGALPDMLERIAKQYQEEVDNALEAVVSLIEPIMIVFMAVVVGTVVIALFMPLVSIMDSLGG